MSVSSIINYNDSKKHSTVEVAGEFSKWNPCELTLVEKDGSSTAYSIEIKGLTPNIKYMYKFIVDGQWVLASDDRGVEDDGNGNLNHVLVASSKISDNAAPPTFVEQTGSATSSEEGYNSSFHSENTDSDEELDQKYQSMTDSKSARSSQDTKVVDEQPKAVDQPLPSSTQPLVNHGEAEQASYGSVAANGENDTSVSKPNKKESRFWIARLIAAFLSGITSFLKRAFCLGSSS